MAIDLATAKAQLNLTTTDDDALVTRLLSAAQAYVERELGAPLVSTAKTLKRDAFPVGILTMPQGPVLGITSIAYTSTAGPAVTLAPSAYTVDVDSDPARIAPGASGWPETASVINAVSIAYTVGWGADADSIPEPLEHAVMMLTAHWYENREASLVGVSAQDLPIGMSTILNEYRGYSYGL